jgi:hypothetical protein
MAIEHWRWEKVVGVVRMHWTAVAKSAQKITTNE